MSAGPQQRQVTLEADIEVALAKAVQARIALAQAEEVLEAAYEELGPIIDQDPRFIRAERKLKLIEAETARRKSQIDGKDLNRSISDLANRFGPTGREADSKGTELLSLTIAQLGALGRSAYQAIGAVRKLIAAAEVAPWLESVKAAETGVRASERALDDLRNEFAQLLRQATTPPIEKPVSVGATDQSASHPASLPKVQHEYSDAARIEKLARKRGITTLVHFTRVANLSRIVREGIIPRSELEGDPRAQVEFNDSLRLDRRTHLSCLSITKINYRMFWRYKHRFPDAEWCILEIAAEVLWRQKCLFCRTNAASSGTVNQAEMHGWTAEGLDQMFCDPVDTLHGRHARSDIAGGLPANHTSDPQAEVLVQGRIDPKLIRAVLVPSWIEAEEINQQLSGTRLKATANQVAFAKRSDFALWQPEFQG
jgi:hypothetical protein